MERTVGGREPLELVLLLASLPELATKKNGYLAERIKRFGSRLISTSSATSHLRLISYHLFPSFLSFSRLGDFILSSLSLSLAEISIDRERREERRTFAPFSLDPFLGEAKRSVLHRPLYLHSANDPLPFQFPSSFLSLSLFLSRKKGNSRIDGSVLIENGRGRKTWCLPSGSSLHRLSKESGEREKEIPPSFIPTRSLPDLWIFG